jgi:hypothetical protein
MRFQLLVKTMQWGAVVGLLLAAISWNAGPNYRLLLDLVVSVGAIVVVRQAARAKQYIWACGFVGMALLLNPIVPVFTPETKCCCSSWLACRPFNDLRRPGRRKLRSIPT